MSKDSERPTPKPQPKAEPKRQPPEVWCHELRLFKAGRLSKDKSIMLSPAIPNWQHGAAAALHCWDLHEHHAGGPLLLTESDYLAALKAAEGPSYKPHAAALSPHAPWAPKD